MKETAVNEETRSISFSPPDITDAEGQAVIDSLNSGWITTGPQTKELERRLAEYCHTAKMVCLASATAAEELNLRILGIGPGDEVIVPAYTYTATASPVIHCGAKVIFVDIQKDGDRVSRSPEMDYNAMASAVTERTKAVIPVDLGGIMCDYDRVYQVLESKRHLFKPANPIQEAIGRVSVVSDCAHALGASRHGKMAGEVSDFSSFSFHATKNLTTCEGGAAAWQIPGVDNEAVYRQYQLYSQHGQSRDALAKKKLGAWEYDIVGAWYKCNMTDVASAIGLQQLNRYPGLLERRKEIITQYDAVCDALNVFHLNHYGADYRSSGHLYLTRVPKISAEQRNEIIDKMAMRGVATNVHYKPLPMMTAYKAYGWNIEDFPNAYDYFHNLITLPLHTKLSDADAAYVMDCFADVLKEYI